MSELMILFIAAIFGGIGVVLGAFGFHVLEKKVSAKDFLSFETAVKYQIYHALLLLFISSNNLISFSTKVGVAYLVTLGIIFFSGSIYLKVLFSWYAEHMRFLWPITPIGGFLFILSWITLAISAIS